MNKVVGEVWTVEANHNMHIFANWFLNCFCLFVYCCCCVFVCLFLFVVFPQKNNEYCFITKTKLQRKVIRPALFSLNLKQNNIRNTCNTKGVNPHQQ